MGAVLKLTSTGPGALLSALSLCLASGSLSASDAFGSVLLFAGAPNSQIGVRVLTMLGNRGQPGCDQVAGGNNRTAPDSREYNSVARGGAAGDPRPGVAASRLLALRATRHSAAAGLTPVG